MKIYGVKISAKQMLITGVVSSVLFFGLKNVLNFIQPDLADKVDITHEDNVINTFFTEKIYKPITGSDQNMGYDIYDYFHKKPSNQSDQAEIGNDLFSLDNDNNYQEKDGDYNTDYGWY